MNIMLIAIAAVVIIGIILAVVMMKKKGDNSVPTSNVPKAGNRPKTLAEQQQERLNQTPTSPLPTSMPTASPTSSDSVSVAQPVSDKKDPLTIAPLAAAAVATTAGVAMNMPSHAEASNSADGIDFDDLDSFQKDTVTPATTATVTDIAPVVPVTQETPTATHQTDDDLAFDFDLEDTTVNATHPVSPSTPVHSTSSEPVFSLDTPNQTDTDFSFDLSEEIAEHTPPTVEKSVEAESFDFDEFDDFSVGTSINHPVETVPTPSSHNSIQTASDTPVVAEEFTDFDLSFDEPAPTNPPLTHATQATEVMTSPAQEDLVVDNEAFNFDLADFSSSPVTADTVPPTPVTSATSEPSVPTNNDFAEHELAIPAVVAPVAAAIGSTVAPTSAPTVQAPVQTPVVEQDFSQAFEVVKGLDNHQIVLDLAEQYIQLGEYDSAKRLLNELHTASPAHQQSAQQLLTSIE